MTIEFADPGYNWLFVLIPFTILMLGIIGTVFLYRAIENAAAPLMIIPIIVMVFGPVVGGAAYVDEVEQLTTNQLEDNGFSNVVIVDDRFSAATEDGEYFSGILVDLKPEAGYAYQVLEVTDTDQVRKRHEPTISRYRRVPA